MFRLFSYALRRKRLYLFSYIGLICAVIAASIVPQITQRIVDNVITGAKTDLFLPYILILAFLYIVEAAGYYTEEYAADKLSAFSQKEMRRDLFSHIQKMDMNFFSKNNAAELMSRTKQDIENVGFTFGFIIVFSSELIFQIILYIFFIIKITPLGLIVPLCIMPFILLFAFLAERGGDKLYDKISDETAEMNETAGEAINGIRIVKAFGKSGKEMNRFDKKNMKFRRLNEKVDFLIADTTSPMSALARLMSVLNILVSGILVINGKMTLGQAVALNTYVIGLSFPMMDMGWILQAVSNAVASARKINRILDTESSVQDGEEEVEGESVSIVFDHVSFSAENKKILDDVSFEIMPSKSLAIMGATGSGKSTICSLLLRFMDASDGKILVNGQDIRRYRLKSLRERIALVSQDTFLFSDSIDSNISIGKKGIIKSSDISLALKLSDADEFVSRLSEKEKTVIGERGVGLSGGQKQRLSIARALAHSANMLILDDATSALDMETEKIIQRSVRNTYALSKIIIAHRISSVRDADEIIFLSDGKIAERGNHDDLMNKKGLYYRTYLAQYGEEMV